MLVPELIRRAVNGELRFDFIESAISVSEAGSLSTLKGQARSEPAHDCFHYHFTPRAPLDAEQAERLSGGPKRQFHVAGTERNSASWTGKADELRIVEGMQGAAIHASVPEWTREDARSMNASFSRIVIAGHYAFPAVVRKTASGTDVHASASCQGIRLDFRNHGHYTEICACGHAPFPDHLADAIAASLCEMLDQAVRWIYRERHLDSQRHISVRVNARPGGETRASSEETAVLDHDRFWKSFAQKLARAL